MARQTKLIYALKDGEITSIADVESGLKCGCVCPACGEPLVAKKGSKVMHTILPIMLEQTVSMVTKPLCIWPQKTFCPKQKRWLFPELALLFQEQIKAN